MAQSHGVAKGTTTHTEVPAGGTRFPPFNKSTFPSQLVSLAIAFVLLYVISSRIALPRVGRVLDARQSKIDGDLADAQAFKDESDAALKAYEGELAAARARAQAIGSETRDELNAQSEAERRNLEQQLAGKLADAEKKIAATRASAMSNVRSIAADATGAIVQRLTGTVPDRKSIDAAVDSSLKG